MHSLEGLKLVCYDSNDMIEGISDDSPLWSPVMWLHPVNGSGFARATGFFESPIAYEKAIEMATYLNAFIYGDDGEIYFIPAYGVIFDDAEPDSPLIYLWDLEKYEKLYGKDYTKLIEFAAQERTAEQEKIKEENRPARKINNKNDTTYGNWIVIALVAVIIGLIWYIISL